MKHLLVGTLLVAGLGAGVAKHKQFIFHYPASGCTVTSTGSQSDTQTKVNAATDGDTVCIPAGTYSWTSQVVVTKAIHIKGAGEGSTIIQDNIGTSYFSLFSVTLSSPTAPVFRISHMSMPATATADGHYPIATITGTCNSTSTSTCSRIRLDHLTISDWWSGGPFDGHLMSLNNVYGVIDHVTVNHAGTGIFANIGYGAYGGVGQYGDNAWAQPDDFGAEKAIYVEDSTFTTPSQFGMAITDSDISDGGGARYVGRFNTLTNANYQTHGTESTGRTRSNRLLEVYNNSLTLNNSYQGDMVGWRGGTGFVFNNTITVSSGTFQGDASLSNYRVGQAYDPWGYCGSDQALGGGGSYDNRTTSAFASGTITSTSLTGTTLVVTDTGSTDFTNTTTFPTGGAANPSNRYFVVNTSLSSHPAAEITSATTHTVTSTIYGYKDAQSAWSVGNTYEIRKTTACLDMTGYGSDAGTTLLSGATPTAGWPNEILRPIYEWGSTMTSGSPSVAWVYQNWSPKPAENVHFYQQQASFTGTVGTGSGTHAARPATCTVGVGYWETDTGGNWNTAVGNVAANDGAFYTCTSTNTWTLYYTPYAYPHPLIAATGG